MDKLTLLSHINLFDELPMEDMKLIDDNSTMTPVKKGTQILIPEQPLDVLFFLKQGQVRLYRMTPQGKQFTTDILVDGNVFGETESFMLTDQQTYAEAMTDCYLCTMDKEKFESFVRATPDVSLKLIQILSTRLKETYDLSEKIALGDVRYRTLFLLLKMSEKSGKRDKEWQSIGMKITHEDIATMVGSSRETISLLMSKLKKEGLLKKTLLGYSIKADEIKEILMEE
ncbi:CRP/FNR family transcription regulator [Planococcus antarcticus DSM 14505]|uniref:CRP/FNR family transcription regulator n=1 Tax=Planococcus antarcticus DSM 14505 TaxID=1185653 RepID=A0AA87IJ09_9BACL|nr:Crp/Fnr family transcriptional regulator [Planococcus antarcticus]EIM05825.1 CRP/FNR family transcription regulator [Planococcus antarcticus DSM 14505]